MAFIHKPLKCDKELIVETDPSGVRHYTTPEKNRYPSITTVLSGMKKEVIEKWIKRVGVKFAEQEKKRTCERGNILHEMSELYIQNIPLKEILEMRDKKTGLRKFPPFYWGLFNKFRLILAKHVNNIYMQESPLYSDKLKIAGRVDLIADYDGVPSIIDFKGSNKEKLESWILSYFMQASGYSFMAYEQTGFLAKQIVVIITAEDGTSSVYIKNPADYIAKLKKEIEDYTKKMLVCP